MNQLRNRRKFIRDTMGMMYLSSLYPLSALCCGSEEMSEYKIDSIERFRYDVDIPRYCSWGTWHNRQHLFMKITSGDHHGWSEIPASVNNPDFNPVEWIQFLKRFKGLDIDSAREIIFNNMQISCSE